MNLPAPTNPTGLAALPAGYADWLTEVKARVRATQFRAARAANTEVLRLYWSIGHDILERQERDGWGTKVVARLAQDLQLTFPGQRGWSSSNLRYMKRFAEAWPDEAPIVQQVAGKLPGPDEEVICQQPVGKLPWGHITVLLDRLTSRDDRDWYAARAVAEGWSRNVLEHFIKTGLRGHLGAAPTNFAATLPPPDSELAQQIIKDPYVFDHLAMIDEITERNVEQALMNRLQDTLLEFGRGMAFVGRQIHLPVTDEKGRTDDLILDLLLFHIPQLRYVVIELKIGDFQPGFLGQLGAYVAAVDDKIRDHTRHAPTIGILLCTGKNEAIVRYTLANMNAALGVADYEGLPADAKDALPSVTELRAIIAGARSVSGDETSGDDGGRLAR